MKIYKILFSPTGGTKKVADVLAGEFGGEIVPVDLTDYRTDYQSISLTPEDFAIVAVPSYGGRVPATAIERFSNIKGNHARAVLVCVYGNRAFEDALVELQDAACNSGFNTIAAVSAVAEHSIARQFAHGRPDQEDRAQLVEFAQKIQTKMQGKAVENDSTVPVLPGNRPYKKRGNLAMSPKPNKDCVQCGVCAEQCPVQAIERNDACKVDSKACISCMRCISVCPHSARKLPGVLLAGATAMLKKVCSERKTNELFL